MPAERDSPSAGWRDVYHELAVDDAADPAARRADQAARRSEESPFADDPSNEVDDGASNELQWFVGDGTDEA